MTEYAFDDLERNCPEIYAEMAKLARTLVNQTRETAIAVQREYYNMPEGVWVCPHRTCDSCANAHYDKQNPNPHECSAVKHWNRKWFSQPPFRNSTYKHLSRE